MYHFVAYFFFFLVYNPFSINNIQSPECHVRNIAGPDGPKSD